MRLLTTISTVVILFSLPQTPLASSPSSASISQDPNSSPTPTPPSTLQPSPTSSPTHKLDLRNPQAGVGAAGGTAAPLPDPTQMSPITTYLIHGVDGNKSPVPYTQLFSAVPDQWPAPTQGVIGLGSISGTVGAVKTVSKREEEGALQTRAVGMGMGRFGLDMGRFGALERRKSKSNTGSGSGSSGAGNLRVEFETLVLGVGLVVGVLGLGIGL